MRDLAPEWSCTRPAVSLLLADDHPVVLQGLCSMLRQLPEFVVVAACHDGQSALEQIRELQPNIAVLDLTMPRMDGLQVLAAVSAEALTTRVVLLTATATQAQILAARARGAKGIITKREAFASLVSCVSAVAAGHAWTSDRCFGPPDSLKTMGLEDELTPREQQLAT